MCFPTADDGSVALAHEALAQEQGAQAICTIPLTLQGHFDATLTVERPRGRPLQPIEQDLCQTAGEFSVPILLCKREQERWLITKAFAAGRGQLARLFGAGYLGRKLLAMLVLGLVAFLTLATGPFRISARSTLEGEQLRAIVAPFNGYIHTSGARAGEEVATGEVIATLDDRDLKLEQVRLATERAQTVRERRQAAAAHERAQVRILAALLEQTDAQLALIDAQLARTRIVAPFDGVLVSGDLSQSLGAPVAQGDVLFELVPAGNYRVELRVDERDIDFVHAGQTGTLVLSALPELRLPFTVTLVTPVTEVSEGRNAFAVEASLNQVPGRLRPGMQGLGKIDIGERKLVWSWTRRFVHWLRVQSWAWWS